MTQTHLDAAEIAHETAGPRLSEEIAEYSSALGASEPTGYRIHFVPLLDQPGAYRFTTLTRQLRVNGEKLFIGRKKDRSDAGGDHELLFLSKVVSHAHAEVILDGGRLCIRDTGSLYGTFLNQLRLSSTRKASRLRQLRDGDIVQFGTDHGSGVVQHYKFVKAKVRIERIDEHVGLAVSAVESVRSADQANECTEWGEMSNPGSDASTDSILDLPAIIHSSVDAKVNRSDISPAVYYKICCIPDPKAPRALHFKPLTRVLKDGDVLRIARFTENSEVGLAAASALDLDRLVFKSRVVSRAHAELWVENRTMFIKDIGSASGTFLNGKRLSPAEEESEAWPLHDGDFLQLGVEYCGGILDIHKPARMKIELCETTSPSCDALLKRSSPYGAGSTSSFSGSDSVLDVNATIKPGSKGRGDVFLRWTGYESVLDLCATAVHDLRNRTVIAGETNPVQGTGSAKQKRSKSSLLGWCRRGRSSSQALKDQRTKMEAQPTPTEVAAARHKERILARMSRRELYTRPDSPCTTDDENEEEGNRSGEKGSVHSEDGASCIDILRFCLCRSKRSQRS